MKPVPFPPYKQNNSEWFRTQAWHTPVQETKEICAEEFYSFFFSVVVY
jgi:hypothetical protein